MTKPEKKALVPALRFPEFRDAGEWKTVKLKYVAKCTTLKNTDGRNNRVLTNSAEYGIVDQRDFFDKDIANQNNLEGYYIVEKGDYVYNPRISTFAPVGPISKNKLGTGVMSPLYTVFRFNDSNNDFYEHYFKTSQWHNYMRVVSNNGARHDRMAISAADFLAMPLPESLSEEQQKIADCLSSIDDLITAQTQKLAALKAHKKGLMQQLFPAEGETVPKLRFPEFRDGWKKNKLENLIELLSGYAFQSEYFSENGKKLLTPKNFTKHGAANFNKENTKFTIEECDSKYACRQGDLLLLLTDLTPSCELLGKPILLKENEEVLLNQRIVKVTPKNPLDIRFLLYFFSTETYHKRIRDTATGSTVRHSSNKIVLGTQIYMPSIEEQQKIADCLSSVDELITAQAEKVEALKKHKKGLMQQLFPSMDEVGA
ncbi:MAG TPA: restriction endonuclease subunit S [Candidatus Thiothrix moscowensis]|uniref:restriction endonuclease subunit S n=1 Tax=unclassified Thiothrix TaxID=2636184 RepID=UPI0025E97C5F|nr:MULTISPECIES: restriction endonuclease subunit S [unclassified Thiothrix]HRJ51524.1 restriction endonuclease subunit S [Candidatus Thiothrix moscowensis]HRJ91839.1 restriction endonuclease subunit S [Candidatus Thiothrix moscowensis]